MADFFSLPYPIRIANDNADSERYIVATDTTRDELITDLRAYEGMLIYHVLDSTHYYLSTLVTGNPGSSVWSAFGGGASTLAGLSDVVSATNTDKFALMANGTTGYVGRALVEADISDLGSYVPLVSTSNYNIDVDGTGSSAGRIQLEFDAFAGTSTSKLTIDLSNNGSGEVGDLVIKTGTQTATYTGFADAGITYSGTPGSPTALSLMPKSYIDALGAAWPLTGNADLTGDVQIHHGDLRQIHIGEPGVENIVMSIFPQVSRLVITTQGNAANNWTEYYQEENEWYAKYVDTDNTQTWGWRIEDAPTEGTHLYWTDAITVPVAASFTSSRAVHLRDTGIFFVDNHTSRGAAYGGDYSTNGIAAHGDRWIPDKGYNDATYATIAGTNFWKTAGTTNIVGSAEVIVSDAIGSLFTKVGASGNTYILGAFDTSVWRTKLSVAGGVNGVFAFEDLRTTKRGIEYTDDYSANFTARSLSDKEYDDSHIGGQNVNGLVITPTGAEDGYVIAWNETGSEYELVSNAGGGGTDLTGLGTDNQLALWNGTDTLDALAAGTNTHVLTMVAGVPAWAVPTGGYTDADAITAPLTGFTASGPTTIIASSTILQGFEYLEYRVNLNDAKNTNVVGNLGFTVGTGEITTTNGTNITIGSFGTANTNYGFVVGSNSVGATYYLDATGTWSVPAGGGSVATDVIWDAAADLVVGTGSNTAARLAKGTGLQILRMNAGATAIEWAANTGSGDMLLGTAQTVTAAKTYEDATLILEGLTSGTSTLKADAIAGTTTLTLPAVTGTLGLAVDKASSGALGDSTTDWSDGTFQPKTTTATTYDIDTLANPALGTIILAIGANATAVTIDVALIAAERVTGAFDSSLTTNYLKIVCYDVAGTEFYASWETSPLVISSELDLGTNSIGGTVQTATGDGTTTIDWGSGNMFNFTFGAFNETFTFTAPTKPGTFILKLLQDSVGSRTATWPGTVEWAGGSAPTLTTTATTGTDIITFYWDGTSYWAIESLDYRN